MTDTAPGWRLGHRPGLDGIRAIAIGVVFLRHLTPQFNGGGLGVDVFFTLSGFLITSLLLEELADTGRIRLGRFWARRALRLYPALLVMVLTVVLLMPWMPSKTPGGVWPALLYYTNWVQAFGPYVGALSHTWSLATEEQFYLLWPLLLLGLWKANPRLRRATQLVLMVAVIVAVRRQWDWANPKISADRIDNGFDYRADGLLIGCALAFAMHRDLIGRWLRHGRTLAVAGVAFGVVIYGSGVWNFTWWNRTAVALATAVVIVHVCQGRVGWLGHPVLRWVGVRSYGLYLWHYPIFDGLRAGANFKDVAWPMTVIAVLMSLVACAVSYRYVEEPFLRLKDRLGTREDRGRTSLRPALAGRA